MKRNFFAGSAVLPLVLFLLFLTSCGAQSYDEDMKEEDITLPYLTEEFSKQLLTDGAEHLVGSIEPVASEDGSSQILLHPKEVASSPDADGTYPAVSYVRTDSLSVPDQMYGSFGDPPSVLSASEFLAAVEADLKDSGQSFDEYGDYLLYDVYALDGQALLILYNPSYVLQTPNP